MNHPLQLPPPYSPPPPPRADDSLLEQEGVVGVGGGLDLQVVKIDQSIAAAAFVASESTSAEENP